MRPDTASNPNMMDRYESENQSVSTENGVLMGKNIDFCKGPLGHNIRALPRKCDISFDEKMVTTVLFCLDTKGLPLLINDVVW